MSKTVKIYCEGKKGSHDYDVLAKVIPSVNVDVQPIGSKKGAGSAIQVYEQLAVKSDVYFFFRDRNFDAEVPAQPTLIKMGYIYYSYRTTIENYLFDSGCFYEFIKEKKWENTYRINSQTDAQNLFVQAAKSISYYQAIRHTMGKMRVPTDFGTTWIEQGSGTLPNELNDKPYCRLKALECLEQAKTKTDAWTEAAFDDVLNTFAEQFDNDTFYSNSHFLIWFQGKDFAKALSLLLPEFPMKTYYQFAKKHFDYTNFEDLVELRQLIDDAIAS